MKKNNAVLLSAPYLIWMVVFTLIPLGVVAYYALTDPSTGAFSLGNLANLGMYLPVLWQSIVYSLISACICLILGIDIRIAYFIAPLQRADSEVPVYAGDAAHVHELSAADPGLGGTAPGHGHHPTPCWAKSASAPSL